MANPNSHPREITKEKNLFPIGIRVKRIHILRIAFEQPSLLSLRRSIDPLAHPRSVLPNKPQIRTHESQISRAKTWCPYSSLQDPSCRTLQKPSPLADIPFPIKREIKQDQSVTSGHSKHGELSKCGVLCLALVLNRGTVDKVHKGTSFRPPS